MSVASAKIKSRFQKPEHHAEFWTARLYRRRLLLSNGYLIRMKLLSAIDKNKHVFALTPIAVIIGSLERAPPDRPNQNSAADLKNENFGEFSSRKFHCYIWNQFWIQFHFL